MVYQVVEIILLVVITYLLMSQKPNGISDIINKKRKIVLDSCALIDGRVIEIMKSGFISDKLLLPQFVLNELQLLADGSDSHKRERARFGLDVAKELQEIAEGSVEIDREVIPNKSSTDEKLIELCKKRQAQLYTTDYNLAKVANIEGVKVLNVNELAQNLRPITLPGETLDIKIVQKGTNRDQGVGYLDDGTMIVVDGASKMVGEKIPVTVSRMHQTVAGKMVFGQIKDSPSSRQARKESHEKTEERPQPNSSKLIAQQKLRSKITNPLAAKARMLRPSRNRVPTKGF